MFLHQLFPRSLTSRLFARMPIPLPLPQTCFGALLRTSYSRITGPGIRRHLGLALKTTSTSNTNSNSDSHRNYTSIPPRSRVQPNHITHRTEWQPTTTTTTSSNPPQSQSRSNLLRDSQKREKFVRRIRRKKGEEGSDLGKTPRTRSDLS